MKLKFTLLLVCIILIMGINNNSHSQVFENILPKCGIEHFSHDGRLMAAGVVVMDYNNDGYDDFLFIGGDDEKTIIFRNNPAAYTTKPYDYPNMFTDVTDDIIDIPEQFFVIGGATIDYDNDGWEDLVLTTDRHQPILVYRNVNGKFKEVGISLGFKEKFESTSISIADINQDGWADIYIANYFEDNTSQNCLPNSFFINQGGKGFVEDAFRYGINDRGCGLANTFSDYDNDGDLDLFVANDFGQAFSSNAAYRNEYPEKYFTNVKNDLGFNNAILGMGVDGGDYDNDGDLDYYATNLGQNFFYENLNGQAFQERGKELKIDNTRANQTTENAGFTVSWSVNWFDFDLDMDLDLHVTNGFLAPIEDVNTEYIDNNRMFENVGKNKPFLQSTAELGLLSPGIDRGAAQIDFDNDGDIDIITSVVRPDTDIVPYNDDDYYKLFENKQTSGRKWIKFKLVGSRSNRLAIGSRVRVFTGDTIQMRDVTSGGGGFLSQSTRQIIFGLKDHETIDSVEVLWPGKGRVKTKLRNVAANQTLRLLEPYLDTVRVEVCENSEMFGKVWTNYGEHFETITAQNGADSNLVYQVFVNPVNVRNINIDVCKGEMFEGKVWDAPGDISITNINQKGCDSTTNYSVALLETFSSTVDTSICYGTFFLGKEYIQDTLITRSLKSVNGCDSITKYNLSVIDAPNYTENFEVCYADLFRGRIIVKREIFTENYPSQANCDSVHTIIVDPIAESKRRDSVYINAGEEYKGKQYFSDDVYVNKIKGGAYNGCDSLYIADIFVTVTDVFNSEISNKLNISVVPNPFDQSTEIQFDITNPIGTKIELINQLGMTIPIQSNINSGRNTLNLSSSEYNLTTGVYFIRIMTGGNSYITKIIKGK